MGRRVEENVQPLVSYDVSTCIVYLMRQRVRCRKRCRALSVYGPSVLMSARGVYSKQRVAQRGDVRAAEEVLVLSGFC